MTLAEIYTMLAQVGAILEAAEFSVETYIEVDRRITSIRVAAAALMMSGDESAAHSRQAYQALQISSQLARLAVKRVRAVAARRRKSDTPTDTLKSGAI